MELVAPLMVAAGMVKTLEQVEDCARGVSGMVVVGSITIEPRAGNSGRTFYPDGPSSYVLNSLGLPNRGLPYYEEDGALRQMVEIAHRWRKQLVVSIAGFTADEYGRLARVAEKAGADVIEVNFGCPNVWHGGDQHRIFAFDPVQIALSLSRIHEHVSPHMRVWAKVSPYSDPVLLSEVAGVLNAHPIVEKVTVCNTFPNAFAFHHGGLAIEVGLGLAGLSGAAMKQIVMGQILQFAIKLNTGTGIIASGGCTTAGTLMEYLNLPHVDAVQVGSQYYRHGERALEAMLTRAVEMGLSLPESPDTAAGSQPSDQHTRDTLTGAERLLTEPPV